MKTALALRTTPGHSHRSLILSSTRRFICRAQQLLCNSSICPSWRLSESGEQTMEASASNPPEPKSKSQACIISAAAAGSLALLLSLRVPADPTAPPLTSSSGALTCRTLDAPDAVSSTVAQGINAAGRIVGVYVDSTFTVHGFLWRKGVFTTIDPPDAVFTDAVQSMRPARSWAFTPIAPT
jgi:probable HAF family extracellular repeat protein